MLKSQFYRDCRVVLCESNAACPVPPLSQTGGLFVPTQPETVSVCFALPISIVSHVKRFISPAARRRRTTASVRCPSESSVVEEQGGPTICIKRLI